MIICHCKVVRADDIRAEVRLGATTVDEVANRCGAASKCGGCVFAVEDVIVDEVARSIHGVAVGS